MPITIKITSIPIPILGRFSTNLPISKVILGADSVATSVTASVRASAAASSLKLEKRFITAFPPYIALRSEEIQNDTASDNGCDLSRNVNSDGVHQKEVLRIFFKSHFVNDTS